jgi:hypothetical protein
MSAPQTDPERQVRRHLGPLVGMFVAVCVVGGLFLGWLLGEFDSGEDSVAEPTDPASGVSTEPAVPADQSQNPVVAPTEPPP